MTEKIKGVVPGYRVPLVHGANDNGGKVSHAATQRGKHTRPLDQNFTAL